MYPEAFASTSHFMNVTIGAINTGVLIFSSFTMVLAVRSAQLGQKKALIAFLDSDLDPRLCLPESEVRRIPREVGGPSHPWSRVSNMQIRATSIRRRSCSILYFAMTGMHAIHMIVGAGLLITLIVMAARNRFSAAWYTPVEMIGLYWHFVDIVWIFLFPLLYLIGHTK